MNLIEMGLNAQAMALEIEDELRRQIEQENAGARLADDSFCQCCGRRGVTGRYCRTCEGA